MIKMTDRKFDTWEWCDKSIAPTALEFEVRCERPVNIAEGTLRYYVKHDEPPIRIEAPDLGLLRDKLDAAVRAFYAAEWKPVLILRVSKGFRHTLHGSAISFELQLEVLEFEIAEMLGQRWHRRRRREILARPTGYEYALRPGDIENTFRQFGNDEPRLQYVLADTPEARVMLDNFNHSASNLLTAMVTEILKLEPAQ